MRLFWTLQKDGVWAMYSLPLKGKKVSKIGRQTDLEPKKYAARIRQILMMRTGLKCGITELHMKLKSLAESHGDTGTAQD